jgi:hypothetical protein
MINFVMMCNALGYGKFNKFSTRGTFGMPLFKEVDMCFKFINSS